MAGRKDYPRFPQHPRAPYFWPGQPGQGAGGMPQRRRQRITLSLDPDTGEASGYVEFRIPDLTSGLILLTATSQLNDLWFRLYSSEADRTADDARAVDDAIPSINLILDALFGDPDFLTLPIFDGGEWGALAFNGDDPAKDRLYYRAKFPRSAGSFYNSTLMGTSVIHATYPDTAVEKIDDWSIDNQGIFSFTSYGAGYPNGFTEGRYVVGAEGQVFGHSPALYGWAGVAVAPLRLAPAVFDAFDHSDLEGRIIGWRADDAGASGVHVCAYLSDGVPYDNTYLRMGLIRVSSTTVSGHISWVDSGGTEHTLNTGTAFACAANSDPDPGHSGDTYDFKAVLGLVDGVQTARVYWNNSGTWVLKAEAAVPDDVQIAGHTYVGLESAGTNKAGYTFPYAGFPITQFTFGRSVVPAYVDIGYVPVEKAGGTIVTP